MRPLSTKNVSQINSTSDVICSTSTKCGYASFEYIYRYCIIMYFMIESLSTQVEVQLVHIIFSRSLGRQILLYDKHGPDINGLNFCIIDLYYIHSLALRCCFLLTLALGYVYHLLPCCNKKVSVTLDDGNLSPSLAICIRDMDNAIGYY